MGGQEWLEKDFYKILGVDKTADDAAIKKAYRKLARTYHPDQNPGDTKAEERFKEIGEAYAVLSDAEQRKQYDAIRAMGAGGARFTGGSTGGFEDILSGMFGGGHGGGRSFQTTYSTGADGFGGAGFEDILSGMFGGGGAPGATYGYPNGAYAAGPSKGADMQASSKLTFKQALDGAKVRFTVEGKTVNTRIPAGVKDGQKIRLRGKGRPGKNGGPAGDLVVTIHVTPHPTYTREGKNLRMEVPVTVAEAALGSTVNVPLIDGKSVKVKVPAGTSSGAVLRVRGKGVKTSGSQGDLLVELKVVLPDTLSEEARSAVDAFSQATADFNPRTDLEQQAEQV
ncbi:MAG: molecular chaperone DnaJ [Actinobacteria bacterium]|nr:MAG: molecular chaperone DnaJ [Actinomycetota bacterium]